MHTTPTLVNGILTLLKAPALAECCVHWCFVCMVVLQAEAPAYSKRAERLCNLQAECTLSVCPCAGGEASEALPAIRPLQKLTMKRLSELSMFC